jgi:GNAT superfamily N-acetyltransferase
VGIVIRLARPADREPLACALRRIWGGHDYIPRLFEHWVKDGGFYLAERGRRIVGCGKVTELAAGELWLEGLRVDPRLQGRGYGAEVSRLILYRALDRRPRSLRFATADRNAASLAIAGHQAFRRIAVLGMFRGRPPRAEAGPEPVVPGVEETLQYLGASEELRRNCGLLQNGWVFRRLDALYARELCRAGPGDGSMHNVPLVRGVRRAGRLDGLLVLRTNPREDPGLEVSFIGGSRRAQDVLRRYLGRVARARRSRSVSAMASSSAMAAALSRLGLAPHTRYLTQAFVFEYNL